MINYKDNIKFLKSKGIKENSINQYNRQFGIQPDDVFGLMLSKRTLFLNGEVEPDICEILKANLLYLESIDNTDIKIYINSPGGCIYSGLGLIDVMEYVKPNIQTINTGLAASMGAVILSAGAEGKRKALKRSTTMIHQPSTYIGYSKLSDIDIERDHVTWLKKELYKILAKSTGKSFKEINKDSEKDFFMSAKQAKKYGLIDEIIK